MKTPRMGLLVSSGIACSKCEIHKKMNVLSDYEQARQVLQNFEYCCQTSQVVDKPFAVKMGKEYIYCIK